MSNENIDLMVVIELLESKKAALEGAINALRAVIATGGAGPTPDGTMAGMGVPFSASGGGEVPDGAFHGKSMPTAIKLYLEIMRSKKTAREIADGLKKGGLESTSKWFDKIVYATLDRMRKAGGVMKIGTAWGLPAWYPALTRAGVGDTNQKPKRKRIAKKDSRAQNQPKLLPESSQVDGDAVFHKPNGAKSEPGPSAMIRWFLRDTPGPQSPEEIQAAAGINNQKVTAMLLGQLVKKGKIKKTEDGKYLKAS